MQVQNCSTARQPFFYPGNWRRFRGCCLQVAAFPCVQKACNQQQAPLWCCSGVLPADLNLMSMKLWREQHAELCNFCGCLMLHDERPSQHDPAYPSQHIAAGENLLQLEPALDPTLAAACQHAKLYSQEGWCDPVRATAAFLSATQHAGAQVLYNQKVCTYLWGGGAYIYSPHL